MVEADAGDDAELEGVGLGEGAAAGPHAIATRATRAIATPTAPAERVIAWRYRAAARAVHMKRRQAAKGLPPRSNGEMAQACVSPITCPSGSATRAIVASGPGLIFGMTTRPPRRSAFAMAASMSLTAT